MGVPLRVAIVEDDSLLRATLVQSLGQRGDIDVVSAAGNGAEIVSLVTDKQVDVALLDVHLGDGPSGFDLAASLRRIAPLLGIVFLSSVRDPRLLGYNAETLPRGARYLVKSTVSDLDLLVAELHGAAEDSRRSDSETPSIPFTHGQIEILRLVAAGYTNQAIAEERFVTERAVEVAVSRLAKHLGLRESPGVNQRVHIATTFFREMGWKP